MSEEDHWITVNQFVEKYPWPTRCGLTAYIYDAEKYGLATAIMRVGRRVLIKPKRFFQLLQEGSPAKKLVESKKKDRVRAIKKVI